MTKCIYCDKNFRSFLHLKDHINTKKHKAMFTNKKINTYTHTQPLHLACDSVYGSGCIIFTINKDKQYMVLCVKGARSNKWGFPKGHLNEFESYSDCAVRETYEETSIKVDKKELKGYSKFGGLIYFYVYKSEDTPFKILDKEEIEEIRWFSEKELNKLDPYSFTSGLRYLVKNIPFKNAYMKGVCNINCT